MLLGAGRADKKRPQDHRAFEEIGYSTRRDCNIERKVIQCECEGVRLDVVSNESIVMCKHKAVYLLLLIQFAGCDRSAVEHPATEKSEVASTVAKPQSVEDLDKNGQKRERPTMTPEAIGVWQLSEYAALLDNKIVEFQGDDVKPGVVEAWLYAVTDEGVSKLAPQAGLELTIRADGSFAERAINEGVHFDWFDSEGIAVDSPTPLEGTLTTIAGRDGFFVHQQRIPSWMNQLRAMPDHRDALRFDDGDTIICDLVRPAGDSLLRVISIVGDGIYLNRIVARYERTRATP